MDVSPRGLRAFRNRPASRRQRSDLVTLAHIKEQSRLSLGSYGRPRMTEELKEIGLNIGHRRVGRLMRQNAISVIRTRKHKVTTIARQAPDGECKHSPDGQRIAKQSAERGLCIDHVGQTLSGKSIEAPFNARQAIADNHREGDPSLMHGGRRICPTLGQHRSK